MAFKSIWTGIELEGTEMFWKREFPNISNQHYWTLDCNCWNTVDAVSTIQVYSHKETFVSDGWIVEWKPFPLLSCQYDCLVRHGPSECSRCTVNKFHIHADIARRKRETKLLYKQTKSKKERNKWLNKRRKTHMYVNKQKLNMWACMKQGQKVSKKERKKENVDFWYSWIRAS